MVNVKKCLDRPVQKPKLHCPTIQRPRCHLANEYVCKRVPRLNRCGYRERQQPRCKRVRTYLVHIFNPHLIITHQFISSCIHSQLQVPRRVCDPVYDDYGAEVAEDPPVCKFLGPKEVCAKVKVGVPKKVARVKNTEYCRIPTDWKR